MNLLLSYAFSVKNETIYLPRLQQTVWMFTDGG